MRRIILLFSTILVLALPAAAQDPAATKDLTISNNEFGFKFKPMGTTINNNFVLFYEAFSGGTTALKARTVGPTGALGPVKTLVPSIDNYRWDVVWHPVVKKFMLVYHLNNAAYARRVKPNGAPGGASKKVCDYQDIYMRIAWTKKKKFVLFLTRGGQLAAQALKKNARKFKTEQILTVFSTGEAYPTSAATKTNGEAVAYYAHYDNSANELTPRLISVDHKLIVYDSFAITAAQTANRKGSIMGKYDPGSRTHSIVWKFAGHSKYCCFNESGAMVEAPTNTPKDITPKALIYNPSADRFAIQYNKYKIFAPPGPQPAGIDHTYIYLTIYNPNGTIVDPEFSVLVSNYEDEGTGVGYAKNGNILGVASPEVGGIWARLIY